MPARATIYVLIGIASGVAFSWAFFYQEEASLSKWAERIIPFGMPIVMVLIVSVLLLFLVSTYVIARITRNAAGTLERVTNNLSLAAVNSHQSGAVAAVPHLEKAIIEGLAWYAPIAARQSAFRATLALAAVLGGLIGTALLFRQLVLLREQNDKLDEQNKRISLQIDLMRIQNSKADVQNIIGEGQRRANTISEMYSIISGLDNSINIHSNLPNGWKYLNKAFGGRIAAFSRSAEPYIQIKTNIVLGELKTSFAERGTSPERGQLLIAMHEAQIRPPAGTVYSYAELSHAYLFGMSHFDAQMDRISAKGAVLTRAFLPGANLRSAYLVDAILSHSKVPGARFDHAVLENAKLDYLDGDGAVFQKSDLRNTTLQGSLLKDVNFSCSDLRGADLTGSDLSGAITTGANLDGLVVGRLMEQERQIEDDIGKKFEYFGNKYYMSKNLKIERGKWIFFIEGNLIRIRPWGAKTNADGSTPIVVNPDNFADFGENSCEDAP